MRPYSLDLTIDAREMAAKAFLAVRRLDSGIVMGTALQRMRERTPFDVLLDCSDRENVLSRLMDLLDELDRLQVPYEISANNVPRSSHLWSPTVWTRKDVASALDEARQESIDAEKAAERAQEWLDSTAGRAYVARKQQLDKVRDRLRSRWDALGFEDLRESEKTYVHVWRLYVEVTSGAFQQYFENSAGDMAMDALVALQSLGAKEACAILSDALRQFDSVGGFNPHREPRWECLNLLPQTAFDDVTRRFYELSEDIRTMALIKVQRDYEDVGIAFA